jgi:hypothetical protein
VFELESARAGELLQELEPDLGSTDVASLHRVFRFHFTNHTPVHFVAQGKWHSEWKGLQLRGVAQFLLNTPSSFTINIWSMEAGQIVSLYAHKQVRSNISGTTTTQSAPSQSVG